MGRVMDDDQLTRASERRGKLVARHGRWRFAAVAVSIAAVAVGLRATPAHALSACLSTSIGACCTITKAGVYTVTSPMALEPLGGDCIDITVPGVVLNLTNHDIHQKGTNGTGIGIHVLATAPGTIVNGGADINLSSQGVIKGFKTGIQNDAPGAFFYAFEAELNVTGVVDNASNATFFSFLADANTGNGVTINSPAPPAAPTANVRMLTFDASGNTFKGVTITATGSLLEHFTAWTNGEDGVKVDGGSGNTLSKFSAGTVGTGGSGNGGWGVRLHNGSSHTVTEGETSLNAEGGIHLEHSNNNRISRLQSFSNVGAAGLWFDGSSRNTLSDFRACGNATSGVYVGCSPSTLPAGTSCGASPHSNGNVIANANVLSNHVGVGIDLANGANRVMAIDAKDAVASTPCTLANSSEDLEDSNTNCGTNFWTLDVFTMVLPGSCIH